MTSTRIPVIHDRDTVVRKPDASLATVLEWRAHGRLAGFRRERTRRQEVAR